MKFPARIIIFFCLALTLVSCNKDKDDIPYYHFRFKINGGWTTWSNVSAAIIPDQIDNTKTNFALSALSDNEKELFDISIQTDGPDFPTQEFVSNHSDYVTYISYVKQSNTDIRFYGATTGTGLEESVYTISITAITDNEVRGTFKGNYLYDDYNEQTASVREGEFVVPRSR